MADVRAPEGSFDLGVETLIIGAGACGMIAALAAHEAGQQVVVVERDAVPAGSTALSAGLIPAAGTRWQTKAGIADDAACFADDIMRKAGAEPDPATVRLLTGKAAPVLEWLADHHGLPFELVSDFDYPGHTHRRMHGLPARSGAALVDHLRAACEAAGIDIVCNRRATTLFADTVGRIAGIAVDTGSARERITCTRLILACNGFGGNAQLVQTHMPAIGDALYFGHAGNQGEAVAWGEALGAATRHLGAYQGHGNVAHPHGILITWAVIGEGGFQVNIRGQRFWNEAQGYSEAARAVLSQPGGQAVTVFDTRIAAIARQFADFEAAEGQGAIRQADSLQALATLFDLPPDALAQTVAGIQPGQDRFGRTFRADQTLTPPFHGVRVTGALFHTQGGLEVDTTARVQRKEGGSFPNLYAAGGAACGVSGSNDAGYLSGNGLLSAMVLGYLAGRG